MPERPVMRRAILTVALRAAAVVALETTVLQWDDHFDVNHGGNYDLYVDPASTLVFEWTCVEPGPCHDIYRSPDATKWAACSFEGVVEIGATPGTTATGAEGQVDYFFCSFDPSYSELSHCEQGQRVAVHWTAAPPQPTAAPTAAVAPVVLD